MACDSCCISVGQHYPDPRPWLSTVVGTIHRGTTAASGAQCLVGVEKVWRMNKLFYYTLDVTVWSPENGTYSAFAFQNCDYNFKKFSMTIEKRSFSFDSYIKNINLIK